jgi:methionine-rich copper-binding protein CopC
MTGRAVVGSIIFLALVGAMVTLTEAHAKLEKTEPAANATVTAAPTSVQLWFSEAPDLKVTKVVLTGPSGAVELGPAHSMGKNNVMAPIVGKMADGKYTVSWQTAGDDGHVQKGEFVFTLKHGN